MMPLLVPEWPASAGVHSAFSLRAGGVSLAPFDTLNLGMHVGDDPLAVTANRHRLAATLQLPTPPVWLEQVHGNAVYRLARDGNLAADRRPQADAIVTRQAGAVLAIQVADCLPVLLASDDGEVLGAAHAGWRGLAAGVLEATVAAMQIAPERLIAWLGPCISAPFFEVGDEVRAAFMASQAGAASAFAANARGRWQCDLLQLARARLAALGIARITGGQWCTYADPRRFFSHRRDQRTGRMAALLWRAPRATESRPAELAPAEMA